MKDYQKRWKPDRRNSVIVTLMGLDELHPKIPFHDKRRGLSESYVRNVASIGLRPGSLVSVGRSCRTDNEGVHVNSRTSSARKGIRCLNSACASNESRNTVSKNDEHCAKQVPRRQQKLEHDSLHPGIDSIRKSLGSQLEMIDITRCFSTSINAFKPKSEESVYDLKDDEFDVHFSPGYREQQKSLKPGCIACSRAMNRISQQERCRSKFEAVLRYGSYSHHPHCLLHRSSSANESKKQKLQRWKMAKKFQNFGVSQRNQTLNEMLVALADRYPKPRNLDTKPGKTGLCNPTSSSSLLLSSINVGDDEGQKSLPVSEFEAVKDIPPTGWNLTQYEPIATENESKEQTTSQNDDLESIIGRGSEQFHISLGVDETMSPGSRVSELSTCSFSCFGSAFNNPEAYILGIRDETDNSFENDCGKDDELSGTAGVFSRTSGDPESVSNLGIKLEEGGKSSAVKEVFSTEASFYEYFEEESAYSNFSAIGPPELENLKRTNQHSPDSVLESFDIKSSPFECFDSTGLRLQLESLNFDSGETCSEGSVMFVSGDEDAEDEFGNLFHDSRRVKRWLGDGQNRNFSYMVDVLDEAGFCGMNSYMDFKMWYSLECPISPLAFEALEKKYGKQTSWQKSERQLLLDRINSGLLEIFNPVIYFHAGTTSIRRRFCDSVRLDELVDELWSKIVSQEKEKSKRALDKWLELEEGIDIICRELEASLFDELALEFASSWD